MALSVDTQRALFKHLNRVTILEWRLGLGGWMNRGPMILGRYMVLTTRGRKTGLPRRTPVNCARDGARVYCVAGFGARADWYRNLVANPAVEVWLPEGAWAGRATTVTDAEERRRVMRAVLVASGFAASLFGGLDPNAMSDEAVQEATAEWPLVRVELEYPLPQTEGPGDLAWVWPLLVVGGAVAWRLRRRRAAHV